MKNKGAFFAILSLALATTSVIVWASTTTIQENKSIPESSIVASQSVSTTATNDGNKPWHYIASGGAIVQQTFVVKPDFGHIELLMRNNSSHEVNVSLTHLDTNKVYLARTILAGESIDWRNIDQGFTQGMLTGNYILQWSGGGYNVDGEVWGAAGSDPSDFPK